MVKNFDVFKIIILILFNLDFITALVCTTDCKYLFSGSNDKSIKIWDMISFENINTIYGHSSNNIIFQIMNILYLHFYIS